MRARLAVCVLCLSGTAAGCGGTEGSAFVLVDREARESGIELRIDGRPTVASLPVELPDPTSRVELVGTARPTRLEMAAGTLTWVRGAEASTDLLAVGADVRGDAIMVQADESYVKRFASALGAGPPSPAAAGMWTVEGPDALARAAWMSAPPEILEAEPVAVLAPSGSSAAAGAGATSSALALLVASRRAQRHEGVAHEGVAHEGVAHEGVAHEGVAHEDVAIDETASLRPSQVTGVAPGLYVANGHDLLLDAEGGFRLDTGDRCGRFSSGRYRMDGDRLVLESLGVSLTMRPDGTLGGAP